MTWRRRITPTATAVLAVAGGTVSALLAAQQRAGVPTGDIVVAAVICAYAGVGLLIAQARPGHLVGRLLLGGAAAWGGGEAALALAVQGLPVDGLDTDPGSVPATAELALAGTTLRGAGWLVLVLAVPLVFPDGRLPRRPWRWAVPATAAALSCFLATSLLAGTPMDERLSEVPNPLGPPASLALLSDVLAVATLGLTAAALVGAVGGLVSRWRSGTRLLRQQLLWLTSAAAVPVVLLPLILFGDPGTELFGAAVLPLPAAIGIAVLQHQLYDVHVAVNRTLLSVGLSAALAVVYVLVVAGVGALLQVRGADWVPWLATGVVALSVLPLRDALQRAANRLTYGQWSQPETVLAGVRRRLADATDVDLLLRDLVRDLGEGLDLSRIVVLDADGRQLAAFGSRPDDGDAAALTETPLSAYGGRVGTLRWSSPRRPLRDRDRRLLDDIAGHLGALVHAAALVTGLRRANERLVLAREEERRRLRRDLHDGVGSRLAGLTFQLEAARNLVRRDAGAAETALERVRSGIQEAVLDVRLAVEGLRPPDLEQRGLAGALTEFAERLSAKVPGGIAVEAADDLPLLPPAVEVAAYRIGQEALSNAVRHAGAARCRVSVTHLRVGGDTEGPFVVVEVTDDGSGLVAERPGGTGLHSMRERAETLGGHLVVEARPGNGTTVRCCLPATVSPSRKPSGAVLEDVVP